MGDLNNIPDVSQLVHKMTKQINDNIDNKIEEIVRTRANPILKGTITKGKMKWRGISLQVHNQSFDKTVYKVIQRGTQIGDDIVVTYSSKII